jgi:predicted SAM-dependent methyltransferase
MPDNFVCLELGPGDSLFSALIARAFGARKIFLVDSGDYATRDAELYRNMYFFLLRKGRKLNVKYTSFEELLYSCQSAYLTSGLSSLRQLPDNSVDFIFSQAVLEHVRKSEFLPILKELRRILKPFGISSHTVDLKDHIGGALNNLRFSDLIWESSMFSKSGFYTNRIRFTRMLALFEKAGYRVRVIETNEWDHLPTPKEKFREEFRYLSDQTLCVSSFTVLLE